MYQIAVVIFREFLEISILLGMFCAAAHNIVGFKYYLIAGIMLGVLGASLLAFFTNELSNSYGGLGDEIFDMIIISITAIMVSITVIWMKHNIKKIKKSITSVTHQVNEGVVPKWIFTFMVATTIFREGSEIVLLVHSIASASSQDPTEYLEGLIIGAFGGIITGIAVYYGLFTFAVRYIFLITTVVMTFIAAGLSAEVARLGVSIGMLPDIVHRVWDTSMYVSDNSVAGKFLKILIGYSSKPSGTELVFYLTTVCAIYIFSRILTGKKN